MRNGLVSFVIPTFNCVDFVRDALDSVLALRYARKEIIVVDGGSTDGTLDILRKYEEKHSNVYVHIQKKKGLSAALNEGIAHADGEYIARMDGDDVCLPTRIDLQVSFLDKHREIFLCGGWAVAIDEEGTPVYDIKYPSGKDRVRRFVEAGNTICHPTWLFRNTGNYTYPETIPSNGEDHAFLMLLLEEGEEIDVLPEYLIKYRIHEKSVSYYGDLFSSYLGSFLHREYSKGKLREFIERQDVLQDIFDKKELFTHLERTEGKKKRRHSIVHLLALAMRRDEVGIATRFFLAKKIRTALLFPDTVGIQYLNRYVFQKTRLFNSIMGEK